MTALRWYVDSNGADTIFPPAFALKEIFQVTDDQIGVIEEEAMAIFEERSTTGFPELPIKQPSATATETGDPTKKAEEAAKEA
jgi:hypothetical protein